MSEISTIVRRFVARKRKFGTDKSDVASVDRFEQQSTEETMNALQLSETLLSVFKDIEVLTDFLMKQRVNLI